MDSRPETEYAKTPDGAHVAYQVVGDGPFDLVFAGQVGNHLELEWEISQYARVLRRLSSFSRLIRFDPRGSGLSDPLGLGEQPSLEEIAKQLLAVLDAAGSERSAIVANGPGGLLAIFFAASYPARTAALVLDGCFPRLARGPDYPWGVPTELLEVAVSEAGAPKTDAAHLGLRYVAPTAVNDPEFAGQWKRLSRATNSPAIAEAMASMLVYADVRSALPAIQAPTLVLFRSGDQFAGSAHARYLAEHINDAKLVELPGDENLIFVGDNDAALDEIEEFLTGARHPPDTNRVLATVLFTDIVQSTEWAAKLGDRKWRDLLDAHDGVVRRQLDRFRGREVNTVGDGFLATFDGPGRAIQCACAIRDAVRPLGLAVRIGLHTGELETRGDDVAGIAVHIAARIAALGQAGDVLVSDVVPRLVAGSGIDFQERGDYELKGVPGPWKVFAVDA